MAKRIRAERPAPTRRTAGSLTYLHSKLGEAISAARHLEDPYVLSCAFYDIRLGFFRVDPETSPYLENENARQRFRRIKELIEPSEDDAQHPIAKRMGLLWIRATRMTPEEHKELRTCLTELRADVGSLEAE